RGERAAPLRAGGGEPAGARQERPGSPRATAGPALARGRDTPVETGARGARAGLEWERDHAPAGSRPLSTGRRCDSIPDGAGIRKSRAQLAREADRLAPQLESGGAPLKVIHRLFPSRLLPECGSLGFDLASRGPGRAARSFIARNPPLGARIARNWNSSVFNSSSDAIRRGGVDKL